MVTLTDVPLLISLHSYSQEGYMGLCYGTEKGKKPAMTAGYTGTKATEAPQKVHVYGADAYELVRAHHPKTCVVVKQSIILTISQAVREA